MGIHSNFLIDTTLQSRKATPQAQAETRDTGNPEALTDDSLGSFSQGVDTSRGRYTGLFHKL